MYKGKSVHYYLISFLLALTSPLMASPGQVSALLMADPLHPRPLGAANAFSALADDESAMNTNPAGLAHAREMRLSGGHRVGLAGTTVEHLAGVYNLGVKGAFGFQLGYLNDTQLGRDLSGNPLEEFNNSNILADWAYAFKLSPSLAMGFGMKGLYETYDDSAQAAAALDIGIQGRFGAWRFGLHAQNLGVQLLADVEALEEEGSHLPSRAALGLAHPIFIPQWQVSAEIKGMPFEERLRLALGTELWIHQIDPAAVQLALRAGYQLDFITEDQGRLSVGLGAVFPPHYELNYALLNFGALGTAHRFSLSVKFPSFKPTGPKAADLKAVYNLKLVEQVDGLLLTWDDPNDMVEGYHVYSDYGVINERITDEPVRGRAQRFIKITRSTTYNFYVRPVGSDGKPGPVSEVLTWVAK